MDHHEAFYKKLSWITIIVLAVYQIGLGVYNLFCARPYYYLLAFAGLLFLPLPGLAWKLLRLKRVWQLDFTIYLFVFLSFSIGIVSAGYYNIPYYDKIMHTLSGVFTAFLSLVLFYRLKQTKKIEREDCALVCVFIFSVSMTVAGLWEVSEYILSILAKTDPQNVSGTGVGDTMQDMIVCLAGTVLFLIPVIIYYLKGKKDFFMNAFETFFKLNFKQDSTHNLK